MMKKKLCSLLMASCLMLGCLGSNVVSKAAGIPKDEMLVSAMAGTTGKTAKIRKVSDEKMSAMDLDTTETASTEETEEFVSRIEVVKETKSSVDLDWTTMYDDVYAYVEDQGYEMKDVLYDVYLGGQLFCDDLTGTSATVTGLQADTAYIIEVYMYFTIYNDVMGEDYYYDYDANYCITGDYKYENLHYTNGEVQNGEYEIGDVASTEASATTENSGLTEETATTEVLGVTEESATTEETGTTEESVTTEEMGTTEESATTEMTGATEESATTEEMEATEESATTEMTGVTEESATTEGTETKEEQATTETTTTEEEFASRIKVVKETKTSVDLDWTAMYDDVYAYVKAQGYEMKDVLYDVYLGGTLFCDDLTGTSATVTGLKADTAYIVEVYMYFTIYDAVSGEDYYYDYDVSYCITGDYKYENLNYTNGEVQNGVYEVGDQYIPEAATTEAPRTTEATTEAPRTTEESRTTEAPRTTEVPGTTETPVVRVSTPKISKAELDNGELVALASNYSENTQQLEWCVYEKKSGKLVKSGTTNTAGVEISLSSRKVFYITCRAIAYDSNGNAVYSGWSAKKYVVAQPKCTSTKKNVNRHSITIKWKKVTGAKNYTIYAKKASSKKWIKVKTTKKTSYKLTKLKGKKIDTLNTKYNFRIVTNAKANGKTIKSSKSEFYSAITTITYKY